MSRHQQSCTAHSMTDEPGTLSSTPRGLVQLREVLSEGGELETADLEAIQKAVGARVGIRNYRGSRTTLEG